MVAGKHLVWPQIRDGKDGSIAKLYNAKGTPTYYVLDRDGKIAAKNVSGRKLEETIAGVIRQQEK